jgi:hypothetical protein
LKVPATVGEPLKVIVLLSHDTVTPAGKPVAAPMPVAPVVACVLVIGVLIHKVVVATVAAVLFGFTIMVPVALTVPQPPVSGML